MIKDLLPSKIYGKWHAAQSLLQQVRYFENWTDVWKQYREGNVLPPLRLRSGFVLSHAEGDDPMFLYREIFIDNSYTQPHFYTPSSSDTVLDLGGNIGFFALYLSQLAPGIKVHSFEPAKATRETFEQNIKINNLQDSLKVYPYGALDEDKAIVLQGSDMTGHRSIIPSQFTEESGAETIECKSLDTIWKMIGEPKIDLLKVDIEGAEIEVFKGASSEVLSHVKRAAIEFHDILRPGCKEAVLDVLRKNGFSKIEFDQMSPAGDLGVILAQK